MSDRYQKRPVEVLARQWFCDGHCPHWAGHRVREHGTYFEVKTLEGTMRGEPGDWIICGVEGEVYPCKPTIFAATYTKAPEAIPMNGAMVGLPGHLGGCSRRNGFRNGRCIDCGAVYELGM